MTTRSSVRRTLGIVALSLAPAAAVHAQTQSLAFTGGVLLNTSVSFRHLGAHPSTALPGPAAGSAVNRTYDDGFNRVDADGNPNGTTVNWGYRRTDQLRRSGNVVMSQGTAEGTAELTGAGSFIEGSGNLEYRGSLGPLGRSDWGILLGVGYQHVGAKETASFVTDATVLEDAYSTLDLPLGLIPPPPYSGSATSTGPRIGSTPSRSQRTVPGGRLLTGTWDFDADLIPISGGLYLETQIAGRLNVVASAGLLALLVNAELRYVETSTIGQLPSQSFQGADGSNDYVFGGFAQLGLDWAIWEKASLVASARWQPAENFDHSVSEREAEIDFTGAFAVHAGVSFRF